MTTINELVVRVPAMGKEEGHALGKDIATRVAAGLPEGLGERNIPELHIRMDSPTDNGAVSMADAIADRIIQQIKIQALYK